MITKFVGLALATISITFAATNHAMASNAYVLTDLGTLGGSQSYSGANAINDAGQVAGYSLPDGTSYYHSTAWFGGTPVDLGRPGNAYGINQSGQVVGYAASFAIDGLGPNRATVWDATGRATDLGTLGGSSSYATAINSSGQIAGVADNPDGTRHAVIWDGGKTIDLGTLGGRYSAARAINNSGQAAGDAYITGDADSRATLWNGTTAIDIGGPCSSAAGINNAGQVVGFTCFETPSGPIGHATLWDSSRSIDLGTLPGGTNSAAYAINDHGQIVGFSSTNSNIVYHATLWEGSTAIDLNSYLDANATSAGWVLSEAYGINSNGAIVGNATFGQVNHAFMLTPVPEPGSFSLTLLGMIAIGCFIPLRKQKNATFSAKV